MRLWEVYLWNLHCLQMMHVSYICTTSPLNLWDVIFLHIVVFMRYGRLLWMWVQHIWSFFQIYFFWCLLLFMFVLLFWFQGYNFWNRCPRVLHRPPVSYHIWPLKIQLVGQFDRVGRREEHTNPMPIVVVS